MKLRWAQIALTEFEDAHDHIAKDNATAAQDIAILRVYHNKRDWPPAII